MDTDTLFELAHTKGRDQFATSLPNLFLLVTASHDAAQIGFQTVVAQSARGAHSSEEGAKPGGGARRGPSGVVILELVKAPGHPYPDRISLGRARNCDLVLRDPSISKLHAHFRAATPGGREFDLIDCDSQNGTRLNDKILAANVPMRASLGDSILFGAVPAKLLDAASLYDVLKLLSRMSQQVDVPRSKP